MDLNPNQRKGDRSSSTVGKLWSSSSSSAGMTGLYVLKGGDRGKGIGFSMR